MLGTVGRTPRSESGKKADTRITIRLTTDEHRRYAAAADAAGVTVADWIRAACETKLGRKVKPSRAEREARVIEQLDFLRGRDPQAFADCMRLLGELAARSAAKRKRGGAA